MKIIAVNGSPRTGWSTEKLLSAALKGAESAGAETELVNLYELDYKGCYSCFECKRLGGESYAACAIEDELAPVLRRVLEADALIIGSPVYFWDVTGQMRSFLERLWFPGLAYSKEPPKAIYQRRIPVGAIYTMNHHDPSLYARIFAEIEKLMGLFIGPAKSMYATETYQFDDYGKYMSTQFDEKQRKERLETVFPEDLKAAFALGESLISR